MLSPASDRERNRDDLAPRLLFDHRLHVAGAEDQLAIAAAFVQVQRDWVASHPGYVSARFLASTDGAIVRAIVEWESEQAFRTFERESDTEARTAALEAVFRKLASRGSRQTFRPIGDEVLPTGSTP